jgi:hypothetical protein
MLQSLILTGFGGLLAIGGAVAGYLVQTRDAQRARAEPYTREDTFRLHQDRRQVNRDFYLAYGSTNAMMDAMKSPDDPELRAKVRAARDELHGSYVPLWHIGAEEVIQAARSILNEMQAVGWGGATTSWERHTTLVSAYVLAVRNDLLKQRLSFQEALASGALIIDSGKYRLAEFSSDRHPGQV